MPHPNFPGQKLNVQHGQNGNQSRNRGPGGHGGRKQKTCHVCNKTGHLAQDCRNAQNHNGRNANGPHNQNGRGTRQNNSHNNHAYATANPSRQRVDPSQTRANDDCYMHPGKGHKNNECKSNKNIWSSNNVNIGQLQPPQGPRASQQQGPRPRQQYAQQNIFPGSVSNEGALSGAVYGYCERCNQTGHIAIRCQQPAIQLLQMVCRICRNRGHCDTECKHTAFCKNCQKFGHFTTNCNAPPADGTLLGPNEAKRREMETLSTHEILRPKNAHVPAPAHFPAPAQVFPSGVTQAWFANAAGEMNLISPLGEVAQDLAAIAVEREQRRCQAIADKCCRAHAKYNMSLLNDKIIGTANFFRRLDPINPQIELPGDTVPTEELERLVQYWINDNSFWTHASMIKKGWNYFRDPRVLEALARNSRPVCHCCSRDGHIFSATFDELFPGTDVLTVDDFDDWGPMVAFRCQCSLNGYSFLQAEDQCKMDFSQ